MVANTQTLIDGVVLNEGIALVVDDRDGVTRDGQARKVELARGGIGKDFDFRDVLAGLWSILIRRILEENAALDRGYEVDVIGEDATLKRYRYSGAHDGLAKGQGNFHVAGGGGKLLKGAITVEHAPGVVGTGQRRRGGSKEVNRIATGEVVVVHRHRVLATATGIRQNELTRAATTFAQSRNADRHRTRRVFTDHYGTASVGAQDTAITTGNVPIEAGTTLAQAGRSGKGNGLTGGQFVWAQNRALGKAKRKAEQYQ